ncbi:MAG TPA: hypothetical protein PLA92_09495 [Fimbriimonadaceae bacterium]|nr:hypothetical protein [Fimbriimonadaceae bacterium]
MYGQTTTNKQSGERLTTLLEPLLKRRAGQREISGLKVYETRAEYGAHDTKGGDS